MSNCHRPLSMWFGENFKSEEESSEEGSIDPETVGLDRPLSLQNAQIFFNHYLFNKDLLSSKKHMIRLERAVSKAHMQIRDSQTIFSDLNEIMSYIVRNIERLSRDSNLVPPLLELFLEIKYRAEEKVELRDSQKIEVQSTLSIEVRGKQIRNENPHRVLYEKYKLAEKIQILDSINRRVYQQGISRRKTEKNRKIWEKKKEKERKEREREEVIESVNELPCKRSKWEEREMDMQEVCKKVKDYEEIPKGWLVNVGLLDDEDRIEREGREDGEVIHDKYGDFDLQDEIRIFESDTEIPEEGALLPQDQDTFNLHEEYKEVISTLDPDNQTAKSPDDEGVYKSSLDYQEESKLPQYIEESKIPINHDKSEPIIKLHKTLSSEESDSAEELSNQSQSESELPDSQHDEAHIFSWYIVPNEELSSYQGRDNDMIIPGSRCLSRFPF